MKTNTFIWEEYGMSSEIVDTNENEAVIVDTQNSITSMADSLLSDARADLADGKTLSVPIAQLSALGAGAASLIPALRTVTQSADIGVPGGLFKLLNDTGSGLKQAKGGFYWGATAESKMGQFEQVGSVSYSSKTTFPINPSAMMMAVALASIEKQLSNIEEMQKQILSFLETEKESEIEADVETLVNVINKYKYNWDNEQYIRNNHKLILDIQRTARKNMIAYQKSVADIVNSKKIVIAQSLVKSTLNDLLKKFKYYRLSLYCYAMASYLEIMLSKNFREEYVAEIRSEIEKNAFTYRKIFNQCSAYLEKLTTSSVETNVMKGIGSASKAIGGFLGGISMFKSGPVDGFLKDSGNDLQKSAKSIEADTVAKFTEVSTPNVVIFIEKMDEIIRIYNHTDAIYFDDKNIYLTAG